MPWVKLDDQFPSHPKVAMLSPAWRPLAVFLHINALCWCNQYLTDGRIPKSLISRLASEVECLEIETQGQVTALKVAEELVAVGLWEEEDDDYVIHDFHHFQPTRREVEARRRHIKTVRQTAGSKGGSKRAANVQQRTKQPCNPVPVPVPGTDGVQNTPPVGAAAAPLHLNGSHKSHALCGRVCLPAFLFQEFARLRGGDEQGARDYVEQWWMHLDDTLAAPHDPIGNEVTFLRQQWEASHPTVRPALTHDTRAAFEAARAAFIAKGMPS